jgi:hypothetical protein
MTASAPIDFRNSSFHYSFSKMSPATEFLFFDSSEQLYFACLKQTPPRPTFQKVKISQIIAEFRTLCLTDDPQRVNLLHTEKTLENLNILGNRLKFLDSQKSFIFRLVTIIYNFAVYGRFAQTWEIICDTQRSYLRHAYYLVGRRFDFLLLKKQSGMQDTSYGVT